MKINFNSLLNILLIGAVIFLLGRYIYLQPKYESGEKAPQFSGTLYNGEPFQLTDLRGHYVLLDFWGSWCGPCRNENPQLVEFYNYFKNKTFKNAKGLEVVSIGIETNRERWLGAIQQDALNWKYHLSDLNRFTSPIAKKYGVRAIPTKYLLNPNGEIIAVNENFEAMKARISKREL